MMMNPEEGHPYTLYTTVRCSSVIGYEIITCMMKFNLDELINY